MADELKPLGILTELDCILDTRFATVLTFGHDKAKQVMTSAYFDRQCDVFPGIDAEDFKERYKTRGREILRGAVRTPALEMVKEFAASVRRNAIDSPYGHLPCITLNIYPYVLTESEITLFTEMMVALTGGLADVKVERWAPEYITPTILKQEFAIAMMYEYDAWLEIQAKLGNLKKDIAPEVTLIGPAINKRGDFSKEDLRMIKSAKISPYAAMEYQVQMFIGLKLLPASEFSMAVKLPEILDQPPDA